MTQQNMAKMVIIDEKSNKSLTLALSYASVMTSHSLATFKLAILNAFFSMLTSTFALNKTSHSSILAANLLAITTRHFYCDWNISDLVIGISIDVPIDVVRGIDDGLVVSSDVRLGEGLKDKL
jgi:hypothetical protein